jgi:hypothetical protein
VSFGHGGAACAPADRPQNKEINSDVELSLSVCDDLDLSQAVVSSRCEQPRFSRVRTLVVLPCAVGCHGFAGAADALQSTRRCGIDVTKALIEH